MTPAPSRQTPKTPGSLPKPLLSIFSHTPTTPTPPPNDDIAAQRAASQLRLKVAWDDICERYGREFDDADEIDLVTCEVVVDKGFIRNTPVRAFGKTFIGEGVDESDSSEDDEEEEEKSADLPLGASPKQAEFEPRTGESPRKGKVSVKRETEIIFDDDAFENILSPSPLSKFSGVPSSFPSTPTPAQRHRPSQPRSPLESATNRTRRMKSETPHLSISAPPEPILRDEAFWAYLEFHTPYDPLTTPQKTIDAERARWVRNRGQTTGGKGRQKRGGTLKEEEEDKDIVRELLRPKKSQRGVTKKRERPTRKRIGVIGRSVSPALSRSAPRLGSGGTLRSVGMKAMEEPFGTPCPIGRKRGRQPRSGRHKSPTPVLTAAEGGLKSSLRSADRRKDVAESGRVETYPEKGGAGGRDSTRSRTPSLAPGDDSVISDGRDSSVVGEDVESHVQSHGEFHMEGIEYPDTLDRKPDGALSFEPCLIYYRTLILMTSMFSSTMADRVKVFRAWVMQEGVLFFMHVKSTSSSVIYESLSG
ncbi:hypothetical protein HK104_000727 [Borealophlyctis nickersoniae]|nr:hypothetical protein HK104_000727 [Borealophlyctis nickersoniae]